MLDYSNQNAHLFCAVCGAATVEIFVEVPNVPVLCNVLWPTRDEALNVQRVDIPLAFCKQCGYIFNPTFDPGLMEYTQAYENSLHFSSRFQQYAIRLAQELVERHQLYNKEIIEIGGGKGDFLTMLCTLGNNHGVSIDPSYISEGDPQASNQSITFIQDYYSEKYTHLRADLICSRHTLEHIPDPTEFVATIRRTIGPCADTVVFLEVPNVLYTLRDLAVWDIIYEHCSYFSPASLTKLFTRCGFRVNAMRTAFDGQFLCIEATPAVGITIEPAITCVTPADLTQDVAVFAAKYRNKLETQQQMLAQLQRNEKKAVIWGAGSKGITFLNILQAYSSIEYAIDINPRKKGMFISGTAQQIVLPSFLQTYRPDVVYVMNSIYLEEIHQIIRGLGLTIDLIAV